MHGVKRLPAVTTSKAAAGNEIIFIMQVSKSSTFSIYVHESGTFRRQKAQFINYQELCRAMRRKHSMIGTLIDHDQARRYSEHEASKPAMTSQLNNYVLLRNRAILLPHWVNISVHKVGMV